MRRLGVTLDSVSLKRLLRYPKQVNRITVNDELGIDKLMNFVISKKLYLVLDYDGGIEGEWSQTCGVEIVRQIIIKLSDHKGLEYLAPGKITSIIMKRLRIMGFNGTGDKLMLRVAVASQDKTIVSDDSDFWNPADTNSPGDENAIVCKFCGDNLDVKVIVLFTLFMILEN